MKGFVFQHKQRQLVIRHHGCGFSSSAPSEFTCWPVREHRHGSHSKHSHCHQDLIRVKPRCFLTLPSFKFLTSNVATSLPLATALVIRHNSQGKRNDFTVPHEHNLRLRRLFSSANISSSNRLSLSNKRSSSATKPLTSKSALILPAMSLR